MLLAALGCDNNEVNEVESGDYAAEERSARCAYMARCGFVPSVERCMASYDLDRGIVQAIGALEFDKVRYDPLAAARYLDQLRELSCENTLENLREIERAQTEAIDGLVEAGGSCFTDEECVGRALCDQTGCPNNQTCCVGVCTAIATLSTGAACPLEPQGDRLTAFCDDASYCAPPPDQGDDAPTPQMGTCQPRADNGSPCDRDEACLDGQRCASGRCFMLAEDGISCNPTLRNGASCVASNQICDAASSVCVDAPGDGQPCAQGRCQPYATCVDDLCVPASVVGEACDMRTCEGDLQCRDNVCVEQSVIVICVAGDPPPPPQPMMPSM